MGYQKRDDSFHRLIRGKFTSCVAIITCNFSPFWGNYCRLRHKTASEADAFFYIRELHFGIAFAIIHVAVAKN